MIFDKANDYLFKIFCTESEENDFNIFLNKEKMSCIGGFLKTEGKEAYTVTRKGDSLGIKIENDYIFAQNKEDFTNTALFKELLKKENPEDISELIEQFKDVEYVQFFESQKGDPSVTSLSYLVNKSSYLLTDFFTMSKSFSRLSISMLNEFFSIEFLKKANLDFPVNPNFDIINNNAYMIVGDKMHSIYKIDENGMEISDKISRKFFLQKVYDDMIDAEKNFYTFGKDSKDCIEEVKEMLSKKFGKNILDER